MIFWAFLFVDGVIEHGRGMGHKFLLPTTNIIPAKEKLMPQTGSTIQCPILRTEALKESPM